ncbi:(2Fe-2S) ferredoxin domain-containing protein [Plebeiibacterium marinum]|uniref:NAD(P)H-dependent oxidoreductase subunit E n=1 Tax=Plebeiibacterium marinum TaxID=2992111 RepID=A0AAE3SJ83_9BACT|nr:NAD(P)H-dependent oxidoreductase subunit E [Plebeiobacterium marinum]MCW3804085.1 NAD(P)H-dependent oxidoreductase subunit E [Plebeiobacterium marinum]
MQNEHSITICMGSSCFSRGNKEVLAIVKKFLAEHDLEKSVFFKGELCTGNCEKGPVLKVDDEEFNSVNPDKVYDILAKYFNV